MADLLVTGGAGFIGSNFVHLAVSSTEHRVTVLDAFTRGSNRASLAGLPDDRVDVVAGSVTDAAVVDELVAHHDVVVHFAAESHNDTALATPVPSWETNVMGTVTLLEAVRRHRRRFHQVSTDEVFGDLALDDSTRFTERSPYRPSSPYAASKAAADHAVRAWVRSYGVEATISICSNNYGPRQHVEKFIPRQVTEVLDGRRPKVYGDGRQVRDWIHVDDHNEALLRILDRGTAGRTYLLGAEGTRSNLEVVRAILRLMGQPEDAYDHVPDRPGHDQRYALDATPSHETLGWHPSRTNFEAGLAGTIDWYRTHEFWWRPSKNATEAWYSRWGR